MLAWLFPILVSYDVVFTYHNRTSPTVARLSGRYNNGHSTAIDPDFFDVALLAAVAFLEGAERFYIVVDHADEVAIELPDNVRVVLSSDLYPRRIMATGNWPYYSPKPKEAYLHTIPGLNETFLYLNDDMLISQRVSPHYFFRRSGQIYTLVGPEHKSMPWWSEILDIRHIGSKPSTKFTAEHIFGKGSKAASQLMSSALYPAHAPRPYHTPLFRRVLEKHPELLPTVFSTQGRCSRCLNTNSLMVAGTILSPRIYKTINAVHYAVQSKFATCAELQALLRDYTYVTVQQGGKSVVDCIRQWASRNLQD